MVMKCIYASIVTDHAFTYPPGTFVSPPLCCGGRKVHLCIRHYYLVLDTYGHEWLDPLQAPGTWQTLLHLPCTSRT